MKRTQLSTLTDREFLQHLSNKSSPTDVDIEAMLRIERLQNEIQDMAEDLQAERQSEGQYEKRRVWQ